MTAKNEAVQVEVGGDNPKLAILLAAAMFVLAVDTSIMNVSISAVVKDLDTTVSGVQSAIALEALVSAAFILLSSKVADLIGRKRAYTIGLVCYSIGALAMVLTQSLLPVLIFWAVLGGIGASLLLPAMQSLIHGNFQGASQAKAYAMVGAAAAIAAAIGPLLGGFLTTYLSWRIGFLLEIVIIVAILSGLGLIKDVPYNGPREIDLVGAGFSILGMGGLVIGILAWQEGAEAVGALLLIGILGMVALGWWIVRQKRIGKAPLLDPDLFKSIYFRLGISQQLFQQIALGGIMIALPIFFQIVLGYNAMKAGISMAPLSLTMFAVAMLASKRAGNRPPSHLIRAGFALLVLSTIALILVIPISDTGLGLSLPLIVVGVAFGLLVSQLNNFTLAPISEERISEAAGVNSAGGNFGLSFGLAFGGAILLAMLSYTFTDMANDSTVLSQSEKTQVAEVLEHDAQVVSDVQLQELLVGQPAETQEEILKINEEARPKALQVALLVPLIAGILGLLISFRIVRLPVIKPSASVEGLLGG